MWKHPPGDEIYRKGNISVFEVDGKKNKVKHSFDLSSSSPKNPLESVKVLGGGLSSCLKPD